MFNESFGNFGTKSEAVAIKVFSVRTVRYHYWALPSFPPQGRDTTDGVLVCGGRCLCCVQLYSVVYTLQCCVHNAVLCTAIYYQRPVSPGHSSVSHWFITHSSRRSLVTDLHVYTTLYSCTASVMNLHKPSQRHIINILPRKSEIRAISGSY